MAKKQKSGLYRGRIKIGVDADGRDLYKYISGRTKRELEQRREEVIRYYIEDDAPAQDRLFGEYAVEWFRVRKEPFVSASSRDSYRTALNRDILPVFGDRNMRAIRAVELQEFLQRFDGYSQTKITTVFATLRAIFSCACQDRILDRSPMQYMRKPQAKPASEKRVLTPDERAAVERVCAEHPAGGYLAAMYYLGVRPGEARGLRWGDFDWDAGTVRIQRDIDFKAHGAVGALKTKQSNRAVPVPDALRAILWPLRGAPDAYLFCGEVSGAPLSKTTAERLWLELMRAANLARPRPEGESRLSPSDPRSRYVPLFTPHALRHNYVTMCWEHGIDAYTTMKLVGHASITTTMNIYTHLSETQMERAKQQVGRMFERDVAQTLQSNAQGEKQIK